MTEPLIPWVQVAVVPTREAAAELALVLESAGLASGVAQARGEHVLIVRAEDAVSAQAEIAKYVTENRGWPPRAATPPPISRGFEAAIAYAVLLTLAFLTQRRGAFGFDWWAAGCADAALIRDGAWWRSLTALTLHADLLHLSGNVLFGALFGVMLAQSVGAGTAWLAFLLTGGIGNWLNAWLQSPKHTSVGASTAVFGALGVQVAHDWMRRKSLHYTPWRRWAPLVIGAALLAWLGGGGEHVDPRDLSKKLIDLNVPIQKVDVGAHVLGFIAGVGLGALLGLGKGAPAPGPRAQTAIGLLALGALAIAWVVALR